MYGYDRVRADLKTVHRRMLYPPISDRRFWLTQILLAIAFILHLFGDHLQDSGMINTPGFIWILLLFVPLVYAGTSFGFVGSLAIAGEGVILDIPVEVLQPHNSVELWGAWSGLVMLMIAGIVLGFRFERERDLFADILSIDRSETTDYYENHPLFGERLLDLLPDGVALIDKNGVLSYANQTLELLTGSAKSDLVGREIELLLPLSRDSLSPSEPSTSSLSTQKGPGAALEDLQLAGSKGAKIDVSVSLSQYRLDDEPYTIAVVRDERSRRTAERLKAEYEKRFHLAFENNVAGMVITDAEDKILMANASFCKMIGVSEEEIIGNTTEGVTIDEDRHITREMGEKLIKDGTSQVIYTKRYQHKNGNIVWAEISRSLECDANGDPKYFIVSVRDITEERSLLSQLSHQAMHDPLTGLANRAMFQQVLAQALARTKRSKRWLAVVFIDLDDFKEINDTFGHPVGDDLLIAVAGRLSEAARSGDLLCRFGGDEFVYLSEGLRSPKDAETLAERLLRVFDSPFQLSEASFLQSASIGIATSSGADDNIDILRDADIALYHSKRTGKSRTTSFRSEMHERVSHRVELAKELKSASESGDLYLAYQPIVNLENTEVIGFEALLRWDHPRLGPISPEAFIPIAERSSLIFDLGSQALTQAVSEASSWSQLRDLAARPFIAVNLSPRQFHDRNLLATVKRVLDENRFEPERLVLEITEGTALADIESTIMMLAELRKLGVAIAIDDFGTGYSSLSYFTLLRPRIVKIDRSFVASAHQNPNGERLLGAMVTLSKSLDVSVIAEGIETGKQLEMLRGLGYQFGQGHFFSQAVPASELSKLLHHKASLQWSRNN